MKGKKSQKKPQPVDDISYEQYQAGDGTPQQRKEIESIGADFLKRYDDSIKPQREEAKKLYEALRAATLSQIRDHIEKNPPHPHVIAFLIFEARDRYVAETTENMRKKRRARFNKEQAKEDLNAGVAPKTVAAKHGVSDQTIYNLKKEIKNQTL